MPRSEAEVETEETEGLAERTAEPATAKAGSEGDGQRAASGAGAAAARRWRGERADGRATTARATCDAADVASRMPSAGGAEEGEAAEDESEEQRALPAATVQQNGERRPRRRGRRGGRRRAWRRTGGRACRHRSPTNSRRPRRRRPRRGRRFRRRIAEPCAAIAQPEPVAASSRTAAAARAGTRRSRLAPAPEESAHEAEKAARAPLDRARKGELPVERAARTAPAMPRHQPKPRAAAPAAAGGGDRQAEAPAAQGRLVVAPLRRRRVSREQPFDKEKPPGQTGRFISVMAHAYPVVDRRLEIRGRSMVWFDWHASLVRSSSPPTDDTNTVATPLPVDIR